MLFYPKALENKIRYLDAVMNTGLIAEVVRQHIKEPFTLKHLPRPWEPGDRSTLF